MIDTRYCQLMADYNQWMNDKLYRACASLPEQELHADKGAFFKSIYLTLIPAFEYDSSRLQQLKTFIDSPQPAIMVMNSQAFVGQGRIISNEENEAPLDGLTWLQALARCRPVVVMDEPQMGMDTEAALKAFADMRPLAKLRYSATHTSGQARNCVYRLTPACGLRFWKTHKQKTRKSPPVT